MSKKRVTLYTDGSSLGNPGPGGYAGILSYKEYKKSYKGSEAHTTNNRMELRAVIEGLRLLKEPCNVEIISDSSYVIRAINEWLPGWIKKGFKGVKNPDLWQEYLEVSAPHSIKAVWVKGHAGHKENELCDKMAHEEATKAKEAKEK